MVGGSSGSCLWAAIQHCKDFSADKRVVCIFVDYVRNYMTKFLNDDWMLENEFQEQTDYDKKNSNKYVSDKIYGENAKITEMCLVEVPTVNNTQKVRDVLNIFKEKNCECVFKLLNIASCFKFRKQTYSSYYPKTNY